MDVLLRQWKSEALWGLIILGLVIVVVWAVLVSVLPGGWWITLLNLAGFFCTVFFVLMGVWQCLRMLLTPWLAFLFALLVWGFLVVVVRSIIMGLFGRRVLSILAGMIIQDFMLNYPKNIQSGQRFLFLLL